MEFPHVASLGGGVIGASWTTLFSLGAGPDGMEAFLDHFKDTFNGWWDDLGQVKLDDAVIEKLVQGMADAAGGKSVADLTSERDKLIMAMQLATLDLRD